MPALNFKAQFAGAVESGKKRQTIRAYRKDGSDPKPGDTLFLYTGMRTKACRKLGEAKCARVDRIYLASDPSEIRYEGRPLDVVGRACLAVNDGFDGLSEMLEWFEQTHDLPFEGLVIQWDEIRHPEDET